MADLHPELFAADVLDQPRVLAEPAPALTLVEPLARRARRVHFLGMGSSRFAALDAASRLRRTAWTRSPRSPRPVFRSRRRPTRSRSSSRPRAHPPRRSPRCAGTSA